MGTKTLQAEYIALLRLASHDMRADVVASLVGVSQLLRVFASQLESAGHEDIDVVVSIGIGLELLGSTLKLEALRLKP